MMKQLCRHELMAFSQTGRIPIFDHQEESGPVAAKCESPPPCHGTWWRWPLFVSGMATFCFTVLAALIALLKPTVWQARQPIVVRIEAASTETQNAPPEQNRRNLQNTAITVLQSSPVLEAVLKEVGPPRSTSSQVFPTLRDVDKLRQSLKIAPVANEEFGNSDVLSLSVQDADRSRAIRLLEALVRHGELALRELQARRVTQTVAELAESQRAAEAALRRDQELLEHLETSLSLDSVTLRLIAEQPDSASLQASLDELDGQIQEIETRQLSYEKMLDILEEVRVDPSRLLTVPAALLEVHPALRRLQEALTDAEVHLITLRGQYAEEHPAVIAANLSLTDLRGRIAEETPLIIGTLQHELALLRSQLLYLNQQRQEEAERVEKLLTLLPQYRTVAARIRSQSEALQRVRQRLHEAQLAQAALAGAQLIVPVEPVQTGSRPVGPGRLTILGGGIIFAFLIGAAIFLWMAPTEPRLSNSKVLGHSTPKIIPPSGNQQIQETNLGFSLCRQSFPACLSVTTNKRIPVTNYPEASLIHRALMQNSALPLFDTDFDTEVTHGR